MGHDTDPAIDHNDLMRFCGGWRLLARTAAILTVAIGTLPGAGWASVGANSNADHPKVHPAVAALAARAEGGSDEINVIVLGRALDVARAKVGAERRHTLELVGGQSMRVRAERLNELASHPNVLFVAPDIPVAPTISPLPITFPLLSTSYPHVVGAQAAWNAGISGAGVGIAVIDSGVASTPDFGPRLVQVQVPGLAAPADTYGHGTFVAGVAAGSSADGRYVGIAPRAKVYGINVAREQGTYTSDIIAGLDWVLANGPQYNIRVVNLSLSETVESSYLASLLDTAVERLWRAGFVIVVSAGNRGAGAASYAPANDPFVITVGSTDTLGSVSLSDDIVVSWSSGGKTRDGIEKPDVYAPGRLIPSLLPTGSTLAGLAPLTNLLEPGYGKMSGTSFSAPQVAGAAALLLELHPTWTPDQVKQVLTTKAASLSGGSARVLNIADAIAVSGTPNAANQGLTPTFYGLEGASTTADPTSGTWNSGTWNSGTWNSGTWNSGTWNFSTWG